MFLTVGSGTSGRGGDISLCAGQSGTCSGGSVVLASGEGTATSSGTVIVLSANGGASGASGYLIFSSGSSKAGNSACYSWVRAPRQADEVEPSACLLGAAHREWRRDLDNGRRVYRPDWWRVVCSKW